MCVCVFESCSLTSHPSPQSELRWSTMGFDPRLTNEPRPKRWWYKLQLHHTLSVHTCSWMCDTSIDTTDKLGRSVDTVTHAHWTRDTSIGTRASDTGIGTPRAGFHQRHRAAWHGWPARGAPRAARCGRSCRSPSAGARARRLPWSTPPASAPAPRAARTGTAFADWRGRRLVRHLQTWVGARADCVDAWPVMWRHPSGARM